ncbi:glycoside hydrolase family 43 protein, partial [Cellulomonas septica]|uniref:glycoside hydrolase family 43 protein n=1 Tax=Cellulomonas septica TaxID=285080 RepID=UPI0031B57F0A
MPDATTPPDPALPTRPVVAGFHPDPTVCRVGDDYLLACSSFEYAPGVPVFRSRDLLTWELVGHALDRPSQLTLDGVAPSGGIYAPTLRHHDGRFWLVTTNVSDGPGHLIVTATDPAGPWSEPVRIRDVGGIDPDLAWDEDGTCHLTWSDDGIVQAVVDPSTGDLLSEPQRLWSGTGGRDPEGPHLYRVGSTWYLLVSEGGTGQGHAVSIARGPSPAGPFEPSPHNPLLTARGRATPVQHTGHADLVQRPDGSWAVVFLGVRHEGSFPGWHVRGRETFAAEVVWRDGWPVLGDPVEPTTTEAGLREVLDGVLPATWVGAGAFPADLMRRADDAWELRAGAHGERSFVGRRQQHAVTSTRARVDVADGAGGLELRLDPRHAVTLQVDGGTVRAVARVGSMTSVLGDAP